MEWGPIQSIPFGVLFYIRKNGGLFVWLKNQIKKTSTSIRWQQPSLFGQVLIFFKSKVFLSRSLNCFWETEKKIGISKSNLFWQNTFEKNTL